MVKVVGLEKLLGMRPVQLNKPVDMSCQSKNLLKIQIFNGEKPSILFVMSLKKGGGTGSSFQYLQGGWELKGIR